MLITSNISQIFIDKRKHEALICDRCLWQLLRAFEIRERIINAEELYFSKRRSEFNAEDDEDDDQEVNSESSRITTEDSTELEEIPMVHNFLIDEPAAPKDELLDASSTKFQCSEDPLHLMQMSGKKSCNKDTTVQKKIIPHNRKGQRRGYEAEGCYQGFLSTFYLPFCFDT